MKKEPLFAQNEIKDHAFHLKSSIQCQDGSIVSRTVVDKKTGTVTLFSFDKGQGLSEHTAPFDAVVLGVEGSAIFTISGKDHIINEGDMIIMPAGKPHGMRATDKFKMLLIMIKD